VDLIININDTGKEVPAAITIINFLTMLIVAGVSVASKGGSTMTGLRIILLGLPAVLMLGARPVSAGPLIFDNSISTCTGNNCSSLTLPGSVLAFGPSAASWVIEAFASPGQCVRLDVTSQDTDLEIVAVAPNGQVFRNDDRSGSDLRPLVKIDPTPNNGWFTVQVQHFNGIAVGANFVLHYARYNTGNPNCASPTPPVLSAELGAPAEESKQDSEVTPPQPSTPGSAE
jgi:hypothetical protein